MLSCEPSPPVEPVLPVPDDPVFPLAVPVLNEVLLAVEPLALPVVPEPPLAVDPVAEPVDPDALPVVLVLGEAVRVAYPIIPPTTLMDPLANPEAVVLLTAEPPMPLPM